MEFSKRAAVEEEATEFAQALERAKRRSSDLCDVTVSNPTEVGLPYETEAIVAALADPAILTYKPRPLGLRSARNALASLWAGRNVSVAPDQIALTTGTSEAYGHLFKLLCDPGDEVLVPEPSYPLFGELARYDNVVLKPYRLGFDGAFHIDFDSVEAAVSPKTRAVIAVSPNNPTGTYVKEDEWKRLFRLGLPIISDEVFASYTLSGVRHPSGLEVAQSNPHDSLVFVLDGLSKYAGLPQIKAAWITAVGPKAKVRTAMNHLEFIADAYLSVSTQAQLALPRLLQISHVTRNAILSRIHRNLACAQARASGSALDILPVEGGWSVPVRLPNVMSDTQWCLSLVEHCDVLTQPGWFYDFQESSVLVLSLLAPEHHFETGISKMVAHLEDKVRQGSEPRQAIPEAELRAAAEG